jgi:hypothetical protein
MAVASLLRMRKIAVVALALLTLAGCGVTRSYSTSCSGKTCTVSVTGDPSFEIFDVDLRAKVADNKVTITGKRDKATLANGETGKVGGLDLKVTSVSGTTAKFTATSK